MTKILTRKEIEDLKPLSYDELGILDTALALYDSIDLANEEIRHAYSDIETHRQRIAKLETENERLKEMVCSPIDFNHWKKDIEVKGESLMKQYIDATYRVKELEAENERLKREQLDWSREALEHAKTIEAENARLKEELEVYMERKTDGKKQFAMMEQIRAENAHLREVVEAAKEAVLCVGFADMMATCPSVRAELEPIRDRFLAALKKVSNGGGGNERPKETAQTDGEMRRKDSKRTR